VFYVLLLNRPWCLPTLQTATALPDNRTHTMVRPCSETKS